MLDEAPYLRVSDYARQALEGTETRQQAASRLLEMAHENPDLYRALMSPMEQTAALRAVNGVVGAERKTVWSAPQRAAAQAASHRPEQRNSTSRQSRRWEWSSSGGKQGASLLLRAFYRGKYCRYTILPFSVFC